MQNSSFFGRSSAVKLIFINIVFLAAMFVLIELILRACAPFRVSTIGHRASENSRLYGWGYSPCERIMIRDPDSGATYAGVANNHGWRDLDREYENKSRAYRILVLGDSITFGAIVPAEKTYTRILEKKLLEKGYDCEVINMAYGGWGTDQELEALKNEGLRYKPDLVIVQFCTNDLSDSSYFDCASGKKEGQPDRLGLKPFYYFLDNNGLGRKENPYFNIKPNDPKRMILDLVQRSQILSRIYAVYLFCRYRENAVIEHSNSSTDNLAAMKYKVTPNQVAQLETVVNLQKNSRLYSYLARHMNKILNFKDLERAIDLSGYGLEQKNVILRILEARWFHQLWDEQTFFSRYADINSYDWRLYLAIIAEMKKCADLIDADIVIFPETEEGFYEWSLYWHHVSDDPISKINYLSHIQVIRSAMKNMGVDVIENTVPYKRARNDPHPNIEGNEAIAEDILKYLMVYKKDELKASSDIRK